MLMTVVNTDLQGLADGLDFIERSLEKLKFGSKTVQSTLLLSEEVMVQLINNSESVGKMHIRIDKRLGLAYITVSAPGKEFDPHNADMDSGLNDSGLDRESESTIRSMLLQAYESRLKFSRKGIYNFVRITAGMPEREFALRGLRALAAALIIGAVCRFLVPQQAVVWLNTYLLDPVQTVFLRSLMLVTAPTVFFSIVTNVARFSGFSDPGRVSVKVFVGYAVTSALAVAVGLGVFNLILPGTPGGFVPEMTAPATATAGETVVSTVVNIIPANIVEPFLSMNTLQLIFLALLCGFALGRAGGYSGTLRTVSDALDTLFSRMHEILNNLVPTAVFFSTVSIMLNHSLVTLTDILQLIGTLLLALGIMVVIYLLIVLAVGLDPLTFLKKYSPSMWNTFLLGSSVSALPRTMRCCKNSLGISPKVYNFSIPFGAIANMDGNCVYLTIAGLFLARLFGVEILGSDIATLVFTVIVLSVGAPIASGSVLLCLTVLLTQMGVSITAISLLLGINAGMEMLLAMSNTIGDVAITLSVAKSEKLLDISVYRAKSKVRKA